MTAVKKAKRMFPAWKKTLKKSLHICFTPVTQSWSFSLYVPPKRRYHRTAKINVCLSSHVEDKHQFTSHARQCLDDNLDCKETSDRKTTYKLYANETLLGHTSWYSRTGSFWLKPEPNVVDVMSGKQTLKGIATVFFLCVTWIMGVKKTRENESGLQRII